MSPILPDIKNFEFEEIPYKELMQNRIYNVLIICSNYDFYLLEEDGRIDEQVFNEYTALNLRYPPSFSHAFSAKSALKTLKSTKIDLVITWLDTSIKSLKISKAIKSEFSDVPIAALGHYSSELRKILNTNESSDIDFVFHWDGNIDIFLAIIKLVEDRMNADKDINGIGVKAILLVEDSLRFYSLFIPLIYRIILKQTRSFVQEGLNEHSRMMSKRGRPKILLATTYEEGISLYEKYKENLLGIISDVTYFRGGIKDKQAGFKLLKYIRNQDIYFPVIIQSSEIDNQNKAIELGAKFIHKHSETLSLELKKHISRYFSFGNFEFINVKDGSSFAKAKNIKEFQNQVKKIPSETIVYHAKRNDFSKWLQARALFPLAKLFSKIEYNAIWSGDDIRKFLIKSIRAFRLFRSRGIIAKFDKSNYDEYLIFSRIGEGSLGGKGRGLAFIDSFLKRRKLSNKYENIVISIPRTVVLSTAVFDEFMEENDLFTLVSKKLSDDKILEEFISKPLPGWAVEDVSVFLSTLTTPVAIRSSSVLEDSLYQPFAGIFSTYMVPNTELEKMLKLVTNAIKSVMASAFYKNSKAYIKATAHTIEESKMAVILQEVTGNQYEDVYYPNISGVARSLNFYPIGDEKSEEGIANIALGLGEIIVGGGRTLRFSPFHPKKVLQLSSPGAAQRETQKYFFGLDMNPDSFTTSTSESINKKKITLRKAKNHQSLKFVASTYDLQNNIIRPGINHDGIRVLSFDNVLKYDTFPIAEILQELLRIGKREMQTPIEIEFAIQLDVPKDEPKVFSFLQIRPIVEAVASNNTIPNDLDIKNTIIFAESALGIGEYNNLHDFVYIKPDVFDKSKTDAIAIAVENINKQFEENNKKYILVGPGRWGSSDPWLGIPVIWPQISSAKIIIESGLDDFRIDPSQGTHFFQNLTSFKVGYLTLNPFINEGFYDIDYLNQQEIVYEDEFLKHIRFKEALKIIIDSKNNQAVIYKEGFTPIENKDIDILPPEGFM